MSINLDLDWDRAMSGDKFESQMQLLCRSDNSTYEREKYYR